MNSLRPTPPFDVIAIDNTDVVRAGLLTLSLSHPQAINTIRVYETAEEVDRSAGPPHVVVLDYWLGRDTTPALGHIASLKSWGAAVLLFTSEEAPHPLQLALRAGADGLCLKNDGLGALVHAITVVGSGQMAFSGPLARAAQGDERLIARLTPKEIEVLRALSFGLAPGEIASRSFNSEKTIETHIENIRRKYADAVGEPVNRARMLREAGQDGYISPKDRPRDTDSP